MRLDRLKWQSKLVLLLVFPAVGAELALQSIWWLQQFASIALWTLGLSLLLGLAAWQSHSATVPGAVGGAALCAALMFSTTSVPYAPWRTALLPVLLVLVMTSLATRAGRSRKQQLGTAEGKSGRNAAQVAANLGMAALACNGMSLAWMLNAATTNRVEWRQFLAFAPAMAALAEAAADTVSSELGQLWTSQPRLVTTWRRVPAGTDGAISLTGTLAGVFAAAIVAAGGTWALGGNSLFLGITVCGGVVGLFVDSLLGATLERWEWLQNDGVNFLSTASAAAAAWALQSAALRLLQP